MIKAKSVRGVVAVIDAKKCGAFIGQLRKKHNLTQAELAETLGVTFQAVSKWENGVALPDVELLVKLAERFEVTIEEILAGGLRSKDVLTYAQAGVDIGVTDLLKKELAPFLAGADPRVMNGVGPYAALYDLGFPELRRPVLVLKSEEPGSKQILAFRYGYTESICYDLINHLVNDIMVMGARPLAVLDTIIGARAEKETLKTLVKSMADACRENGCTLVGGETSIQPGLVEDGRYILSASIAGIADRERIVDGSQIQVGDTVIAVASNGLHTNGYSLVRLLMEKYPALLREKVAGEPFLDVIMRPHRSYYHAFLELQKFNGIHGMAHITGGGIAGNLIRILPESCQAVINLNQIKVPPVFDLIRKTGNVPEADMLDTFNLGIGLVLIVAADCQAQVEAALRQVECNSFPIGEIGAGAKEVELCGSVGWKG